MTKNFTLTNINIRTLQKRVIPGFVRCTAKSCKVCPYVAQSKDITSSTNNYKHKLTGEFGCNTKGVIYVLTCDKCSKQYVGQTIRKFSDRLKEHMTSVDKKDKTIGAHYLLGSYHITPKHILEHK